MSVFVIAESGGTHDGRFESMKILIDNAAVAGCDCYKSQWTSDHALMCVRRNAPAYAADYRKIEYPIEFHGELRAHAEKRGMAYGCSVYLAKDATAIAPFVDFIKLSSFEAGDDALLTAAMKTGRRVIVSTGMCADYNAILPTLAHPTMPWAVLHCCSSYVAPLSGLNLQSIKRGLAPALNGYSDHSRDVRVGAWAVAAGAAVIETHMRLDDCDPTNKDYAVSFTPAELAEYVRGIRDCETAMGDGIKKVQVCEREMLKFKVKP